MKKWANNRTLQKKNIKVSAALHKYFTFQICFVFECWLGMFFFIMDQGFEHFLQIFTKLGIFYRIERRFDSQRFILKLLFNPLLFSKSAFPVSNFTINNKFSFLNNNFNRTGNFPSEKLLFSYCCMIVVVFFMFFHTKNYSTKNPTKHKKKTQNKTIEL